MKVALYCRVSMEETDSNASQYQEPENQLQPLRNWAKEQGWEIYKEYVDRGSGANPARPAFREMMNEAMIPRFNSILVWRLDRFSREGISVVLGYIEKLRSRGVGLKSQTEMWLDTSNDNPITEMFLAVFAWVAKEERRKISERTKAGIQRLRNIGQWRGGKRGKDKKPRKTRLTHERYLQAQRAQYKKGGMDLSKDNIGWK